MSNEYSLYYKVGGRMVRITPLQMVKAVAVRTFQTSLLDGALMGYGAELKKVRPRWSS